VRHVALLAVALVAAGCGSTQAGSGRATVWVTRDRGAHVLHVGKVPAGLNAMQAVERLGKVETTYGGRYLRSVDGVEEHGRRAWFYYVNGYLADRASTDYRLRAGDVLWWDYRSWRDPAQDPVIVGAFPEPFLHGYAGKRRPAAIVYAGPARRRGALALGRVLHTRFVRPDGAALPKGANVLLLTPAVGGAVRFEQTSTPLPGPGGAVFFTFSGDPLELARHPRMFRFRYSVP
jgi:Domain of unknown function (DUF4430)